jgi:hypothetical protein
MEKLLRERPRMMMPVVVGQPTQKACEYTVVTA